MVGSWRFAAAAGGAELCGLGLTRPVVSINVAIKASLAIGHIVPRFLALSGLGPPDARTNGREGQMTRECQASPRTPVSDIERSASSIQRMPPPQSPFPGDVAGEKRPQ